MKATYCLGCSTTVRTDFLWFVRVTLVFPATKSHSLMVESWLPVGRSKQKRINIIDRPLSEICLFFLYKTCLPVMTCGSAAWHLTVATVLVWPVSVCTLAFVLMSHTCIPTEKAFSFIYNPMSSLVTSGSHLTAASSQNSRWKQITKFKVTLKELKHSEHVVQSSLSEV